MQLEAPRTDGRTLRYRGRREELLASAAEYVLDHGTRDLSLRPMAHALGVTHATLIRHFDSKESLLAAIVEHLRVRLLAQLADDTEPDKPISTIDLMHVLWRRLADPKERRQFFLMAEIYGFAMRDRSRFAGLLESTVNDFIQPIEDALTCDGFSAPQARVLATALLAQIRGLQLDLAATGDHRRVNSAFAATVDALLGPNSRTTSPRA
jgi:AcrR family transcriptional regulator